MANEDNLKNQYIGIDIGETELCVAIGQTKQVWTIPNTPADVDRLIGRLKPLTPPLIVLEPTGGIEIPLAASLAAAGLVVAVVNARQIRDFAGARNLRMKGDKSDAMLIAHFAEALKPEARPLKNDETMEIDALVRRRKQLQEIQVAESNRLRRALQACEQTSLRAHLEFLKNELKSMEKQLAQRIKASPIWREKDQLLQSVPGVGKVLSATLLAGVPELGHLSRTEVASLIGVAPFNDDSCNTNKVRHIQGGRQDIRKALFCTTRALVSRRYNPLLVEFYERLRRNGKPKKVALVACMRKLLIILNSIVATNTPWRVSS